MYEEILKYVSKHIDLEKREIDIFFSLLQQRKILKKQYLLQAGDVAKFEYFVKKGCLRTFYADDKGEEHIVQFSVEDWWTGDLHSFLTQTPALYHIQALEDSELFQLDNESVEKLYEKIPKFERFFRIIIQNAYVASQYRIISIISKTAEERYLEFVKRYPNIEQRVPQYMVASYLGITPEFLSKIRKQFTH